MKFEISQKIRDVLLALIEELLDQEHSADLSKELQECVTTLLAPENPKAYPPAKYLVPVSITPKLKERWAELGFPADTMDYALEPVAKAINEWNDTINRYRDSMEQKREEIKRLNRELIELRRSSTPVVEPIKVTKQVELPSWASTLKAEEFAKLMNKLREEKLLDSITSIIGNGTTNAIK